MPSPTKPALTLNSFPCSSLSVPYVVTATVLSPCEVTILEPDTLYWPSCFSFLVISIVFSFPSTITFLYSPVATSLVCCEKLMEKVASWPCIMIPDLVSFSPKFTLRASASFITALWYSKVLILLSSMDITLVARAPTATSPTNPLATSCCLP